MHIIDSKTVQIPSVDTVVNILSEHTKQFGVPLDLDRMYEYEAYYTLKGTKLRKELIKHIGLCKAPNEFKDEDFSSFLQKIGVKTGLLLTPGGAYSMGKESLEAAIATGLYSEETNMWMQKFIEQKEAFKAISVFKNIFKTCPIEKTETWDNHRMIIARPIWVPQNTNRIGAREPGIMNFGHNIHDIYTVPKGYIYAEIDSGQIEPRIIQSAFINDAQLKKCTMFYNDAYYGYIHYCLFLTDVQRASGTLDFGHIEITEDMKALRKDFKTFGNSTMYGSTENNTGNPHKAAFIKYIGGHPNRIAWQKKCENDVDRGITTVYTAFGTPIDLTKAPRYNDFPDKRSRDCAAYLVRCSINSPIQGTAADLMRYSVVQADKFLKENSKKSHILQYVHDAGKFAIHEDEYDNLIGELKEITAYQVDDWVPIYAGIEEGVKPEGVKRFIA